MRDIILFFLRIFTEKDWEVSIENQLVRHDRGGARYFSVMALTYGHPRFEIDLFWADEIG